MFDVLFYSVQPPKQLYSPQCEFEADKDHRDLEDFTKEVNFNITAPLLLLREFVPLVRKSQAKKILVVTSALGSIERASALPNLVNAYSVAKAALNM